MKKRMLMMLLCGALVCLPLGGCGTNNANADAGSVQSEAASENKTTKSSNGEYTSEVFAMDTYMTLTAYGENAEEAVEAGIAEIQRLDALLSTGDENSEVAQINQNGGGTLSEDTEYLVKRALDIYQSTNGAFDISIYPVMQLWGFTTGDFAVPSKEDLAAKLALVDAGRISLTEDNGQTSIALPEGMEIDLGGIAKGYTSGRVMEVMKSYGIESAVINLGGNAHVLGSKTDGSAWKVGIQDPNDTNGYLGGVSVRNKAIITSGGYERYFVDEDTGVKYHHIIDPKTGYSANNGLISVTIVSADSTLADGLSTSLFVLGTQDAIAYCQEHCAEDGFDAIMEDEDGKLYITDGIMDDFINMNNTTNIQEIKTK
ncbi:FAD:protein FMN transferase [uncultured Eubacterium sp.]|uniref:FAD:protein FMN transferase n=1 Tax=uncultured Eubacterium sp. TaxID=165185 RepID=UPI0025F092E3|nr:FAD:protein FMN transferase [uncultured Eubacterium sp.]MCI6537171.1 FAD:protein FMN transferase [Lachnospiraceae bacterium]